MSGGFTGPFPRPLGAGSVGGATGLSLPFPGLLPWGTYALLFPAGFDWNLSPLQQLAYVCRASIWRRLEVRDSLGRPIQEQWRLIAVEVPCLLQHTASDKAFQQGLVYVESDNIFTLDLWHFPRRALWRATDWVELTAAVDLLTGEPWDDVGAFWRLRGDAEPHQIFANKNIYRASRETPPDPMH